MRLAIIGCGSIGMRHLKNALALGCEVLVVEADAERGDAIQAQFPTIDVIVLDRVYAVQPIKKLDALMVCTPYDTHLKWARTALFERTPLFIEKPLGSLDQIEDWRRLVQASESLVTQVGYCWRFDSRAKRLKAMVPHPVAGRLSVSSNVAKWPGRSYGPYLLEGLSHEIDLALWFGAPGEPQAADLHRDVWQFRLGQTFELYGNGRDRYQTGRYWKLQQHDCEAFVSLTDEDVDNQMYLDELSHFLECVQSAGQTDVPLKDGLRVLEVVQQVEAMARQHA